MPPAGTCVLCHCIQTDPSWHQQELVFFATASRLIPHATLPSMQGLLVDFSAGVEWLESEAEPICLMPSLNFNCVSLKLR
jgi:hypothetical protein